MKPTERFSDRVSNYVKYRPSYPAAALDTLFKECNVNEHSVIADIGSGTGKLTELLLERGSNVIAVEPNKEMREAAESSLQAHTGFTSVDGTSEVTGLADGVADVVIAAQAFHWFEPVATKREFARILKSGGRIALIWNQRDKTSDFQHAYDQMLTAHCPEYKELKHTNIPEEEFVDFFAPTGYELFNTPYVQHFDKASFLGRMYSSSYTPNQHTDAARDLHEAAEALFDEHQQAGQVAFVYETNLYISRA